MKLTLKKSNTKAAFTIIELLTVMSIIILLIGLLVPALNKVKRYGKRVKQKSQFHSIGTALELFNNEWDGYPPSNEKGDHYCGAMKLAEAMVGQDLLGFHPDSHFRSDGTIDGSLNTQLYPPKDWPSHEEYINNLRARRGPYLQLENANAHKLKHLYGTGSAVSPFDGEEFVLCDVYNHISLIPDASDPQDSVSGKTGMPILYYKADTSKTKHNLYNPDDTENIYDYKDNDELVKLGIPGAPTVAHPMASSGTTSTGAPADPKRFYEAIHNKNITTTSRPYRADSYILLSAGYDGLYGTADDVFNFGN